MECFFARKPPEEVAFVLRALDCSDVLDLAAMYGEARDSFKSVQLMDAVGKRMTEVIAEKARADSKDWNKKGFAAFFIAANPLNWRSGREI